MSLHELCLCAIAMCAKHTVIKKICYGSSCGGGGGGHFLDLSLGPVTTGFLCTCKLKVNKLLFQQMDGR